MNTSFDHMSPNAQLWIFQAERELTDAETALFNTKVTVFLENWTSHNNKLKAAGTLQKNRFIFIAVDQNQATASGCSIDKLMHFISIFETAINCTLTDRTLIAFEETNQIITENLISFKEKIKTGLISPDAVIFDNSITKVGELQTKWQVPIKESWSAKYLPQENSLAE